MVLFDTDDMTELQSRQWLSGLGRGNQEITTKGYHDRDLGEDGNVLYGNSEGYA